jgi:hypothetical protein
MKMNQRSRRNFLRGAGAALTLPWLESLPLQAAPGATGPKASQQPPKRFACIYFSNGVEPIHWFAKGSGKDMELGPGLIDMKRHCGDFSFIKGLYNHQAFISTSPHLGRSPNLLSGAKVSLDPTVIQVGTSFDQILAQRIGGATPVSSLALGIEPNELRLEDGLSMIYGSCISWATPNKPATKEIYPARVYDLLVGDGSGRQLDRSILDSVLSDTHRLQPRLSRSDQHKLGEYLESIRSIERRIEHAAKEQKLEGRGWRPSLSKADMLRPDEKLPQDVPAHMKLMLDLIVLGFQMDKTRIVTLMLNNDLSQMNFKFLEGVKGALHLDLTHNQKAAELEAMYLKTNQFHIQQFAYLLDRMKSIDEGGSTLLDNSALMLASSLFDGDAHSADHLPILLAGKLGGELKPGQNLDYFEKGEDNRRACSLYLSLMDKMGVRLDSFGDTSKRLSEV